MPTSDTPIADLEPAFTRDSLLKAPDWRYQTATACLADSDSGRVPRIPTDPCVQYLIRALRAYRRPEARELVELCWGPIYKVIHLGTAAADSAVVSEIETLLIQGATRDDPEVKVLPVDGDVYDLYAQVFFDLTGVRAVHSWMQDYLFSPETARGSWNTKLRSRLLAYYGGESARSASVPARLEGDALALMKNMMASQRQARLFDYVMKKCNVDKVTYAQLMEAALRDMTAREFTEHLRERADAASGSLEDIAAGIESGIRAFSQTELDSRAPTGLDFTNQYTRSILGNDNGTENNGK